MFVFICIVSVSLLRDAENYKMMLFRDKPKGSSGFLLVLVLLPTWPDFRKAFKDGWIKETQTCACGGEVSSCTLNVFQGVYCSSFIQIKLHSFLPLAHSPAVRQSRRIFSEWQRHHFHIFEMGVQVLDNLITKTKTSDLPKGLTMFTLWSIHRFNSSSPCGLTK